MIERLVQSELEGIRLYHVRMSFSQSMSDLGRVKAGKLLHLARVVLQIVWYRLIHRVRILYYPPAGPDRTPMLRDLVILLCTRWMFSQTIFHFHAGGLCTLYSQLPPPLAWLFRRAYFRPDAAVRLSQRTPPDPEGLQAKREFIIPNGIDDCAGEYPHRSTGGATAQRLGILFVGLLCESKGVLVLLEAARRLAAQGVDFRLEIMGEFQSAAFESTVKETIAAGGLADRVDLLGVCVGDKKYQAYARADVFCLPSFFTSEAFPIVLLEAMSFRLPVVATRWRGIPSIVEDAQTGFLADPHSPEQVAQRLADCALDPQLREQLGAAGRKKFAEYYTIDRHLARVHAMLHAVATRAEADNVLEVLPAETPAGRDKPRAEDQYASLKLR